MKGFEHAQEVPSEVRDRAVRMTLDRLGDHESVSAAAKALARKLNVGVETLRKWVVQAQIDAGAKAGPSSAELEEINTLKRGVRDLKEANSILQSASIFFARELDPHHR